MKRILWLTMACAILVMAAGSSFAAPPLLMNESIHNDFFFLGDFHTYDYASSIDFYTHQPNGVFGGYWIGTGPNMANSISWSHTLPADLSVPPDVISRARLWIDAAWVDRDGNTVDIQGTMDWDPLSHHFLDNTTYDLGSVDVPDFWNGGSLDVSVTAGEYSLRIDQAILMMDYTNGDDGTGQISSAPEPATFALFAFGLVGLGAGVRRMRKGKA